MPVEQKSETELILHTDYAKMFLAFTKESLQTNQAQMSMQRWLL